ncbi:MAG: formate dehydrogenase accessory protein FdhE [Bacillota bacterium]|nr:formate dehydrogenase accessory protein FdhE [Thermoanaerobacteraceae bacterium]
MERVAVVPELDRQEAELLLQNMVALWRELLRCKVGGGPLAAGVPTPEHKRKWGAGMPWVMLVPPRVSEEVFCGLVARVAAAVKGVLPDLEPEVSRAVASLNENPSARAAFLSYLQERIVRKAAGTEEAELPAAGALPEVEGFLAGAAVKLLMRAYAQEAAHWFQAEDWQRGICPVCGNYPGFSVLQGEERVRLLYCELCGTKWRFHRLGCPYCGTGSGEQSLFVFEEGPKYRVYLCRECRGYLKAFDTKLGEPEDLLLENVRTLFLDLLLIREGYRSPALEWSNFAALTEGGGIPSPATAVKRAGN